YHRAGDFLELEQLLPGHVGRRVIEDRQAERTLRALIFSELALGAEVKRRDRGRNSRLEPFERDRAQHIAFRIGNQAGGGQESQKGRQGRLFELRQLSINRRQIGGR